jgi:hypothetical protein
MNRNRLTCWGIFLVLFCCTPAQLKSGGDGGYGERSYRVLSGGPAETDRRFEQIMEHRDIRLAINTLRGEGFTPGEIQEAVQNRNERIGTWPGHYCSASGTIGEEGEGTVVGPTYYLIIGHARLVRGIQQQRLY